MSQSTGKRVAKIAGRVLAIKAIDTHSIIWGWEDDYPHSITLAWKDIRALAASCLTQAPDKPKKKWIVRRNLAKPPRKTKRAKEWTA